MMNFLGLPAGVRLATRDCFGMLLFIFALVSVLCFGFGSRFGSLD